MARKTLSDFNYNYQAYANYLESAECANDDGYDILIDVPSGNIYERTEKDWTKGHGHNNVNDPRPPRDPKDPNSIGREWKNPWLKYAEKLNLTIEEIQFLNSIYNYEQINKSEKNKINTKTK